MRIVIAGIVEREGRFLICQRRYPEDLAGKWEFPGGKLENGETHEECLARELFEELRLYVSVHEFYSSVDFQSGNKVYTLMAYKASYVSGEVTLKDHQDYRWVKNTDLCKFEFAPADIPFVQKLLNS